MSNDKCCKKNEVECIQKKAYELWELDGRKDGQELNYWLKAEKNAMAQTGESITKIKFKGNGQGMQVPQEKRNEMYQQAYKGR